MALPSFKPLTNPGAKPATAIYDPNAAPNMAAGWVAEAGGITDAVGDLDVATQGVTVADSPYGSVLDFAGGGTVTLGSLVLTDPCTIYALVQTGPRPGGWVLHRGEVDGIGWQVTEDTAFPAAVMNGSINAKSNTVQPGQHGVVRHCAGGREGQGSYICECAACL